MIDNPSNALSQQNKEKEDLSNNLYTTKQASKILEVKESAIRYWVRTKLIKPARWENKQRISILYSFTNLVEIKMVNQLRKDGASTQAIRKAVETLRKWEGKNSFANKALIVVGDDVVIYQGEEQLISLVKKRGQIIWADIALYEQEVQSKIEQLIESGDFEKAA